jgi:hypothetical protein
MLNSQEKNHLEEKKTNEILRLKLDQALNKLNSLEVLNICIFIFNYLKFNLYLKFQSSKKQINSEKQLQPNFDNNVVQKIIFFFK